MVLASGDSMLLPLVEALTGLGCRVEIAGMERGTADELIRAASVFLPIRAEWMFKEPKFASTEPLARRSSAYEGLPDDNQLELEAAQLAARQRGLIVPSLDTEHMRHPEDVQREQLLRDRLIAFYQRELHVELRPDEALYILDFRFDSFQIAFNKLAENDCVNTREALLKIADSAICRCSPKQKADEI